MAHPSRRQPRARSRRGAGLHELLHGVADGLAQMIASHVELAMRRRDEAIETTIGELRASIARLEGRLHAVERARGPGAQPDGRLCKVAGCFEPHVARGYCKNHYQQARYRERKLAEAKAAGKRYVAPKPGERRPGRKPKVPLLG